MFSSYTFPKTNLAQYRYAERAHSVSLSFAVNALQRILNNAQKVDPEKMYLHTTRNMDGVPEVLGQVMDRDKQFHGLEVILKKPLAHSPLSPTMRESDIIQRRIGATTRRQSRSK
jgi:hypothetical protein